MGNSKTEKTPDAGGVPGSGLEGQVQAVGDQCLLVSFGTQVNPQTNAKVQAFIEAMLAEPLPGVMDIAPAFTTVALQYDPMHWMGEGVAPTAYEAVAQAVQARMAKIRLGAQRPGRVIELPVCYGGDYGPDLDSVAEQCGMTTAEVIALHGATEQPIYTFFFAPGQPFAGMLDARLHLPRLKTPRTRVPAGSVAIANGLTCIYPVEIAGGWRLIGRTPWRMFDLDRDPPTRLQLGDRVKFVPISAAQFDDEAWQVWA